MSTGIPAAFYTQYYYLLASSSLTLQSQKFNFVSISRSDQVKVLTHVNQVNNIFNLHVHILFRAFPDSTNLS